MRKGASCSLASAISSPWRRRRPRRGRARPARSRCGRRWRGTRSRGRARPFPSRARTPCRPTRSCGSGGRRGCRRARRAPAARREAAPRAAPAGTRGGRGPRRRRPRRLPRQRLERLDVRACARRPDELRPERVGLRGHELDRHALDGDADGAAVVRSTTATMDAERSNASRTGSGGSAATTTARSKDVSAQRRGSPATVPPSRSAMSSTRSARAVEVSPRSARRGSAASRSRMRASVTGPIPLTERSRPASATAFSSSGVCTSSARPISSMRAGRCRGGARSRRAAAGRRAPARRALRSSRSRPARQPGGDAGADPAKLLHPAGAHELGDGRARLPHRLGCAPVGARGVAPGPGQLEENGERLQPLGDLGVVRPRPDYAGRAPARRGSLASRAWSASRRSARRPRPLLRGARSPA